MEAQKTTLLHSSPNTTAPVRAFFGVCLSWEKLCFLKDTPQFVNPQFGGFGGETRGGEVIRG